ncbi:unnamed protein product [Discosporangium mesarthrocarpum]
MSSNENAPVSISLREGGESTSFDGDRDLCPDDMSSVAEETDMEHQLLGQLQDLHQRLADVRKEAREKHPSGTKIVEEHNKLIICAVRKPLKLSKSPDGDGWVYEQSMGGFKSAIDSLMGSNKVRWVSWLGGNVDAGSHAGVRKKLETEYNCTPVFLTQEVEELYYHQFSQGVLWPLFHCIPTNLNEGLLDNFTGQYEAYAHANKLFLEAVASMYEEGDLVLVHDYDLMLLPALLRKRFPDVTCGFFLHCPFPSTELYRMLPVRRILLEGILGADLVSFNHFDYVRHFLNSCTRILGLESYPSRIEYNGRLISVSICPMGINPEAFEITPDIMSYMDQLRQGYSFEDRKVLVSIDRLDLCKGIPLKLLAIESLLEKYQDLRGKVVMFVIIRDDGRRGDRRDLRKAVDGLVGHVNGKYGKTDYCPVHYIKKKLSHREMVALWALADVALVTSLREGVNLGAMEFIACQQEARQGVLVYSEFAGCATSFKGAMLVNPYDPDKVAETIYTALTMPVMTKKIRHHTLSRYVNHYTSDLWALRIVSSLLMASQKAREYNRLQRLDTGYLQSFYGRSRRRLLVFDYDGTLVAHHALAQLAAPPPNLLQVLEALCEDPANVVYIISGRRKSELEEWLGGVPRLGLIAEHGFWVKPAAAHRAVRERSNTGWDEAQAVGPPDPFRDWDAAESALKGSVPKGQEETGLLEVMQEYTAVDDKGSALESSPDPPNSFGPRRPLPIAVLEAASSRESSPRRGGQAGLDGKRELEWESEWIRRSHNADLRWRGEVRAILQSFTDRTPGSFLELKDSGLTWHFQDTDPDFGQTQAKNLQLHFEQMLQDEQVRVVMAPIKKYIVIQPSRINKGKALSTLLHADKHGFDLILGVGDERTDEDMFDVLQGSQCFTCTVGPKISKAQYYLEDADSVVGMLQGLAHVSQQKLVREREKNSELYSMYSTPRAALGTPRTKLQAVSPFPGMGSSQMFLSQAARTNS